MGLIEKDYCEVLKPYMLSYYQEILCHRGICDIRDGLSEVQRKGLWTCYKYGFLPNKNYIKCARIIGNILQIYFHGNASAYEAFVNMSHEWTNQLILVDCHGNNGTQAGQTMAAERYLEAKMHENAYSILFEDMNKNCIDMIDTFDHVDKEPMVLPSKLPLYFINGNTGIAGGYAVSVPTHNPNEVIDETLKLLKDPNHQVNLYPDFPSGGYIYKTKELEEGYSKGRGRVIIRGKFEKDEKNHCLIITEIPYLKTLITIKNEIKEATKDKKIGKKNEIAKIQGIKDINDGSCKGKIRLVIQVKKDYSLDLIEQQLYKYTSMQTTFPIIFLGTEDRQFRVYNNATEPMQKWIDFRRITIKRIKLNDIKKYKFRVHIIDGLLKILDPKIIDKVLKMIKSAKGKQDVIDHLIKDYKLSSIQAENIAELKLYKLSAMSIQELKDERIDLLGKIDEETKYFKDQNLIDKLIENELKIFKNKFKNIKRKTIILEKEELNNSEDNLIRDTEHLLIVSKHGYIKKLPPINSQRRNGKGINVGKLKENDYPVFVEELSNKDEIYIFTEIGKVYKFKISDLNEGNTSSLGNYISNQINNEEITSCIRIPYDLNREDYGILITTKDNKIKITEFKEFNNITKSGIIASKLNNGDKIISASLIKIKEERIPKEIIVTLSGGNSSLIDSEDVPIIGRTTFGCSAMNNEVLNENNYVVSASTRKDEDTHIFVISKNGYGKLIDYKEFTKVKRGAKGMMCAKLKENDSIAKAVFCNPNQEVTLVTNKSMIKINLSDVSIMKRPTFGVSLKNMEEDEIIIDVSLI